MWESTDWLEKKDEAAEAGDSVGTKATGCILIVDDDPHFLRVLGRILSGENFQVNAASGATEALDLLRKNRYDVIISDLRMPDNDGLSLLQQIRTAGSEVPVIILTAYGEVDTYLEAMNAGATEYLNKPIKSDELLKVVRTCLRFRNSHRDEKPHSP